MSARHVDRTRVRAVCRAAEKSQSDVAVGVGVSGSTVAGWELGSSEPDQERLPALARVLGQRLDELFPRRGLPDLRDLRCDVGLYRYETKAITDTKSDGSVAGAEQGIRPLNEKYVAPLARAYRVTEDELRKAQLPHSAGADLRVRRTGPRRACPSRSLPALWLARSTWFWSTLTQDGQRQVIKSLRRR
ncbi:helix-turn-helix domain-containing protein [Streptomyces bauhiniae]